MSFEGEAIFDTEKEGLFRRLCTNLGFQRISFGVEVWNEGYRENVNLRPTLRHLQELAEEAQVLFKNEVAL